MTSFSVYKGNIRFWLKGYLFLGVVVLTTIALLYSNRVIERMQKQSEATTRLFSRFIAEMLLQVDQSGKRAVIQEVLGEIDLPIIFTDSAGRPIAWHHVGVAEPSDEDFEQLLRIDPEAPPPGKIARLVKLTRKFDSRNDPIPVKVVGSDAVQGYVHFGSSRLQGELRLMPLLLVAVFLIFMAAGFQGFRYLKLSEERSIWVGMAKETAHQLGTPLSALLGWIEIIKEKCGAGDVDRIAGTVAEMEEDLARLGKITERFSKIGSRPELEPIALKPILERTVGYFHKRLPSLKADSTIRLEVADDLRVMGNAELLEWVFENLVKNSIDAIGREGGLIEISSRAGARRADVLVHDTGKGIPPKHRQRIFSPGFTTKKRGWGLGLALTRRIVEEYHGGELRLVESQEGGGTTFLVRLPLA
jgi:hypothetical protein